MAASRPGPRATQASPLRIAPRRPSPGRDLARLHHLLEVAQVLAHLLVRLLAEEARERGADVPQRGVVVQRDVDLRAATARRRAEAHRAGVGDLGTLERAPGDQLVLPLVEDLRLPLHRAPAR